MESVGSFARYATATNGASRLQIHGKDHKAWGRGAKCSAVGNKRTRSKSPVERVKTSLGGARHLVQPLEAARAKGVAQIEASGNLGESGVHQNKNADCVPGARCKGLSACSARNAQCGQQCKRRPSMQCKKRAVRAAVSPPTPRKSPNMVLFYSVATKSSSFEATTERVLNLTLTREVSGAPYITAMKIYFLYAV